MPAITHLFCACKSVGHHPRCFREAHTIAVKKPNKGDYILAKAYRPIALLNTLGKALESVIANRMTTLAEQHKMLPDSQMGGRRRRSCETALELLTEQIHIVWNIGKDKVATLLSMDVVGTFDHVSRERLLHSLRKRRMPEWRVPSTGSFMQERRTTLTVGSQTTEMRTVAAGIPQELPVSPILYLFYNADILDDLEHSRFKVSPLGFMDDSTP